MVPKNLSLTAFFYERQTNGGRYVNVTQCRCLELGSVDLTQFRQPLAEVEAEADDVFTAVSPAHGRVRMTH